MGSPYVVSGFSRYVVSGFSRTLAIAVVVAALASDRAWAQIDLSGEWAGTLHEDLPHRNDALGGGPEIGDYTGLPINDSARLKADSWDASILSVRERQAIPSPTVYSMRASNIRISTVVDAATQRVIAFELYRSPGNSGTTRTIWMDGRAHPPDHSAHTWQGFSTGRWDGGMLVVETSHLKAGWIQRNGVATSDRATLTERFIRHGNRLTVVHIVNDPIYLEEPFLRTSDYVLDLRQQLAPVPRQIVDEIASREKGYVPHHLPGMNLQVKAFAQRLGLPFEATRGGKDTTYPEYQVTLKHLLTKVAKGTQ